MVYSSIKDISFSICFLQRYLQTVDGIGSVMFYDGIQPWVSILGNGKDGSEAEQSPVPEVSWS